MQKPEIVAICGSTRFIEGIAALAWKMEKEGIITLAPLLLPPGVCVGSHAAEQAGVKEQIDELFLRKIDLADHLLVFNQGGYIGESTRNEISYAEKTGKPVAYLWRPTHDQNPGIHPGGRPASPPSGDSGHDAG